MNRDPPRALTSQSQTPLQVERSSLPHSRLRVVLLAEPAPLPRLRKPQPLQDGSEAAPGGPANESAARPAARASLSRLAGWDPAHPSGVESTGRGRARWGGARAGWCADWPAQRSGAVNGGWARQLLQNKGLAARGAAAGGCLALCRGANGRSASRATPGPPESRALADLTEARAGWALRAGARTAERP